MGILSKLLVLVTERLLALAASPAAPLAPPGMSTTPALAAMPLLLIAPHRMWVHWSRMLGVSSSTSLVFSSAKGSNEVLVRLRMPLALSSMLCEMCRSTALYITCGSTT